MEHPGSLSHRCVPMPSDQRVWFVDTKWSLYRHRPGFSSSIADCIIFCPYCGQRLEHEPVAVRTPHRLEAVQGKPRVHAVYRVYHDDSPCQERLRDDGFCVVCRLYPDTQSKQLRSHCPWHDEPLTDMVCPRCHTKILPPLPSPR